MKHPYTVIDTHCDTAAALYRPFTLSKNAGHLDAERMQRYAGWIQFFGVFTDSKLAYAEAKQSCDAILQGLNRQIAKNKDSVMQVTNSAEIETALHTGKIGAFFSLEGAGPIGTDLRRIDELYAQGVRCIGLTWNDTNALASGVGELHPAFGLTPLGRLAVRNMNTLGILIDVSHLSERSFWDVCETSSAPILATHSNAKALCRHRRNLTDSQFEAIVQSGGVVGINFYPLFLSDGGTACVEDIVRHIEYFMARGGEDHLGLGSDFDGIETTPADLRGVQDMYRIFDRLAQLNYTQSQMDKISYKNMLGLIQNVCG